MPDPASRAAAYTVVLEGQVAAGDGGTERTRGLVWEAIGDVADDVSVVWAILGLARVATESDRGAALDLLERAWARAREAGVEERAGAVRVIAQAMVELEVGADQVLGALEALAASDVDLAADAFLDVAWQLDERGEDDVAARAFRRAREVVLSSPDGLDREIRLQTVARAQLMGGHFGDAVETAVALSPEDRSELLVEIALEQAQAGDDRAARGTLLRARASIDESDADSHSTRDQLMAIARALLDVGDPREAVTMAEALGDAEVAEMDVRILLAGDHIESALEMVDELEDDFAADRLLTVAVRRLLATGELERARSIADRMRYGFDFVAEDIVDHAVEAGRFEEALLTATSIADELQRSRALARIAVRQADAGLGEAAVRTTELIRDDQAGFAIAVAERLALAGDRDRFKRLVPVAASSLHAAYAFCGLLARVYPDDAEAIAAVITASM